MVASPHPLRAVHAHYHPVLAHPAINHLLPGPLVHVFNLEPAFIRLNLCCAHCYLHFLFLGGDPQRLLAVR